MSALPRLRVLRHGVDWLEIAYRVELAPEVMASVVEARRVAVLHGRAPLYLTAEVQGEEHGPTTWGAELRAMGMAGAVVLENPDVRVTVEPAAAGGVEYAPEGELTEPGPCSSPGWTVTCKASNDFLISASVDAVAAHMRRVAALFGRVLETRLRRIDLAADVVGADLHYSTLRPKILKRSRSKLAPWTGDAEPGPRADLHVATSPVVADGIEWEGRSVMHTLGQWDEGLQVAPGALIHARLYDKTLQRKQRGMKRDTLERAWRGAMWNGERVDRVEFQLRGRALRELGIGEGDGERIRASLPSLWLYLVGESDGPANDTERPRVKGWMRIVVKAKGERTRSPTDRRWKILQALDWGGEARPLPRIRKPAGAMAAHVLGAAVSLLARRGELPSLAHIPRSADQWRMLPRERVAEVYIEALWRIFRAAAKGAAAELIEAYESPAEALARFLVRHEATRLRLQGVKKADRWLRVVEDERLTA